MDAETGEPLEGVAVIGVWNRRFLDGRMPLGSSGWVSADETATDPDGRFTLPARRFVPARAARDPEPQLGLFKAGYGGWRLRDGEATLTMPGAVIEMRPLRSPDERRNYLQGKWTREARAALQARWHSVGPPPNWIDLPYREAQGFEGAINRERAALGLRPIGIGYWFRGAGRVHGFAPDGRHLGTWSAGDDGQRLRLPQGIAVDAEGRLHVADHDVPRLVVITPDR